MSRFWFALWFISFISFISCISSSQARGRPSNGEARVAVALGEGQVRDLRFGWMTSGGQIDIGLNISNGPAAYLGSRGWKDGFYAGGGIAGLLYIGVYGLVGHEARFGPLIITTEFWSIAASNKVVSSLAHVGMGIKW